MERLNFKFAASAVMIICAANGAQAGGGQQEVNAQSNHSRFDDFDRWKQVVVLSAFVDVEEETATLRGLHFGKKTPTVFCETEKMKVLRCERHRNRRPFPEGGEGRDVPVYSGARQSRSRAR